MLLSEILTAAEFESQISEPGPLRDSLLKAAQELARHHRIKGEIVYLPGGANYVAAVGPWNVIKIFPPFHRFMWEAEVSVLKALVDRPLPIPVSQYRFAGELGAWGYVVMSRLAGASLESLWPDLQEVERCQMLQTIGQTMLALHSLPRTGLPLLDPPWELFWSHQRARCLARHQSLGQLPEHLLAELPDWLEQHVSELAEWGPRVLLTGEYTPPNLLVSQQAQGWQLAGMFDFADSMIGPARYDWCGPLCFLVAGRRARLEAFLAGYGLADYSPETEANWRREQLSYLLLHRYSNPRYQIAAANWQQAPSLEALSELLWPAAQEF